MYCAAVFLALKRCWPLSVFRFRKPGSRQLEALLYNSTFAAKATRRAGGCGPPWCGGFEKQVRRVQKRRACTAFFLGGVSSYQRVLMSFTWLATDERVGLVMSDQKRPLSVAAVGGIVH